MANMSKAAEVNTLGEEVPGHISGDVVLGEKQGTSRDIEDMKRMGKEQLFKVTLGPLSSRRRHVLTTASHSVILVSCPSLALP
jgi:hypothetical protein